MGNEYKRGLFIAIEGPDKAGKSTIAEYLANTLRKSFYTRRGEDRLGIVYTCEPGGTPLGSAIKDAIFCFDEITPKTELLLFAADRAQHIKEVIFPALERGDIVVCDRFVDSSKAYQLARGAKNEDVDNFTKVPILPDLTIYLDVDYSVKQSRMNASKNKNRFDCQNKALFEKIRKNFYKLYQEKSPEKALFINTSNESPVDIFRLVRKWILDKIKDYPHLQQNKNS